MRPSVGAQRKHGKCFATFISAPEYMIGVETLYQSLQRFPKAKAATGTSPFIVMKTSAVRDSAFDPLLHCSRDSAVQVALVEVPFIRNPYPASKERYKYVMSKLFMFSEASGCKKVIYLDAYTIVLKPLDNLFHLARKDWVVAAPDKSTGVHCDKFNSGVMALVPSDSTFDEMSESIGRLPSYDAADQGYLNSFFNDTKR